MLFRRRKAKNRRSGRDRVLDVKLHSKQVRAARVRWLTRALVWSVGMLASAVGIWRGSQWAVEEFVYRNPTFAIEEIAVQTDGIIPQEQLREWTNVRPGENLFVVDPQNVRRFLKFNSLIRDAAVERVLPDTLSVRVTEREPIAQFMIWEKAAPDALFQPVMFYLDEEGFVLTPSDLPKLSRQITEHFEHLPRLLGADGREIRRGQPVASARILAALRFIAEFRRSPMAELVELREVDVSLPPVLAVVTARNSIITFGYDALPAQLQRWRAVHEYAQMTAKSIATLDLSVSNNVPARWQEASSVLPAPSPPVNPFPRYKKKHV
jgi:cell division septal protein FtsQ